MSLPKSTLIDLSEPGCIAKQAVRVIIDGQQADTPFYVDRDLVCASTDGRPIIVSLISDGTAEITEVDGSPIGDGATPVNCQNEDVEATSFCYQAIADANVKYTKLVWFEKQDLNVIVATTWLDASGAVISAPADVEPCEASIELDRIVSNWLPLCIDGVQWYVREAEIINNIDGSSNTIIQEYKQGANGVVSNTVPAGTITDGLCLLPKADIVICEDTGMIVSEVLDVNIAAVGMLVGTTVVPKHTQLDTNLNIPGTLTNDAVGSGINVDVLTAQTGVTFNYIIEYVSDSDPASPSDPDFGVTVIDNATGQVVIATDIVDSYAAPLADATGDPGFNGFPLFAAGPNGTVHNITWTGDLPVGSYSVIFIRQDLNAGTDETNSQIIYPMAGTQVNSLSVSIDNCSASKIVAPIVSAVTAELPLTKTVTHSTGNNPTTVASGYKSVSVTAISADVTIDGASVPVGFEWSVGSSHNERYTDTVLVTGTDYIITEVR